ncbi:hypothetical protein BHYA_0163g00170 [Botrytis hyacinthi]|uniref:Uncharacterized protein n=1 Tax=Botrytis hyacinthi TaxID=278943 RepID=A0A4Z1GIJ5_9HELO|nr:hypothetical protein BHYA_0163g00170 [Botrytis hyacinthi]
MYHVLTIIFTIHFTNFPLSTIVSIFKNKTIIISSLFSFILVPFSSSQHHIVVQTKLRQNESSPIPEHTSTAAPTISNAVSVTDLTPVIPLADNNLSVVSIAVTVSFIELLVEWLLAVSVSAAKIVGITIVPRGQARSEDELQMYRWAAAC